MTEASEHSEFMKTVEEIKLAEQQSDEILRAAKVNADNILRKAKEDVQRQRAATEEKVVAMKNSMLEKGSKEIEAEVQKIVKDAGHDAERIRKEKLTIKDIDKLVKEFLTPSE
jgi:vacuolar-type H+-ATPase subunit H